MQNLWEKIVKKLIENNQTIATMESCTGGGIANEITNISGASNILKISYITYSNEAKICYGVNEKVIKEYSVYSKETAIEMAKCAQKNALSNWAIGVTGQLGRIDPANPNNEINKVFYAIVNDKNEEFVFEINVKDVERKKQKEEIIDEIACSLEKVLFCNQNVMKI